MSKNANDHPDAAIFALVEQGVTVVKELDEASAIVDQASERCRHVAPPPDILCTEEDRRLGLYVGNRAGAVYGREDIPVLRAFVRRNAIMDGTTDIVAWKRACDILNALRDLKDENAREALKSGMTEARRR